MDDVQNANPTILNPSDLPSRRIDDVAPTALRRNDGSIGLFDDLTPNLVDPYAAFGDGLFVSDSEAENEDDVLEEIDAQEIYDLISPISDPEHPLSLGSLAVVNLPDIQLLAPSSARSPISTVRVDLTPTINHCSLATVIGLGVRVRLEQALSARWRVDVRLKEGTHATADAVNKQLADKERVAAALENATLVGVIRKMLSTCE